MSDDEFPHGDHPAGTPQPPGDPPDDREVKSYDPAAVRRLLDDVLGPEVSPTELRRRIDQYNAEHGYTGDEFEDADDGDDDDESFEDGDDGRATAAVVQFPTTTIGEPFNAPPAQARATPNGTAAAANGAAPAEESPPAVVYDFRGYDRPVEHPAFDELRRFVHWLVWHFELGEVVPQCWAEHDAIAEELAAIFEARRDIWAATAKTHNALDQTIWLGYLEAALVRIEKRWDRNQCGASSKHQPNIARSVWAGMAGPETEEPF